MLGDWPVGTLLGVFAFVCLAGVLFLVCIAVWGVFIAADSWCLPRKRRDGRVVGKAFTPAHTEIIMIYTAATLTRVPHPICYQDEWLVSVDVDGKQDSMSVSEKFFDSVSEGDAMLTEYVLGRFSRRFYVKGLAHV